MVFSNKMYVCSQELWKAKNLNLRMLRSAAQNRSYVDLHTLRMKVLILSL